MTVDLIHTESAATQDAKGLNGSDRVLAILNVMGSFPDGIGLNELARLVHSPRSSVHRALSALRRANLIEQDRDSRYRLGYGLLKLAFSYYEELDEVARFRPVLTALAQKYGETTHFAVLDNAEVMYLAKVQPARSRFHMKSVIGGRNPAYCTGVGKCLLAYQLPSYDDVERWVTEHRSIMVRFTPTTLLEPEELHHEFTTIRERGYAVDRAEHEPGINCLALPLFMSSKTIPDGALSITAVTQRFPLSKLEASVDHARKLIRERLGEVLV